MWSTSVPPSARAADRTLFKLFRRLVVILIVLAAAGYGVAEVYAKGYAEERMVQMAEERDPLAQGSEASVSAPLIFGIVRNGTIARIEISNRHLDVGPFIADQVSAVLTGVHLDRAESFRTRSIKLESIDRIEMSVEVTQEEASKVLPEGFRFEFSEDRVSLIGGDLEVSGRFEISGHNEVTFTSDEPIPGARSITWRFGAIPFVTCISSVELEEGLLIVVCTEDNPPAQFPPDGLG